MREFAELNEGATPQLVDAGHIFLVCENCRARLIDVHIIRPDEDSDWKVRAINCPFCDENPKTAPLGGSYYVDIHGRFILGGYGELREGCDEDDIGSTIQDDIIQKSDFVWDIKVKKFNEGAKPVYER